MKIVWLVPPPRQPRRFSRIKYYSKKLNKKNWVNYKPEEGQRRRKPAPIVAHLICNSNDLPPTHPPLRPSAPSTGPLPVLGSCLGEKMDCVVTCRLSAAGPITLGFVDEKKAGPVLSCEFPAT